MCCSLSLSRKFWHMVNGVHLIFCILRLESFLCLQRLLVFGSEKHHLQLAAAEKIDQLMQDVNHSQIWSICGTNIR
ncbi:hypothetical protein HanPSC8_Chr03g0084911 [Helianthus annuus]|nr:hypothetical protein HanPSC8_Chr03g0084911 [Helianthus annuus]